MLLYDADAKRAARAFEKLCAHTVGMNDLRVCSSVEIAELLGERYPRSSERSDRLIDMLTEIYDRENSTRLDSIASFGKRDAATYLSSIPGINQFVLAQVLLAMGHTAFPLDDRLRMLLGAQDAIDKKLRLGNACDFIETVLPASQMLEASNLVLAWAETRPFPRLPISDYTRAMAQKSCRPENTIDLTNKAIDIGSSDLED